MITRRRVCIALGVGALAPLASFAQSQSDRNSRIGFLIAETVAEQRSRVDALRAGLRELGYVEGRNIAIEFREAAGNYDRLPELAADLARLKVDVLVAFGIKAVLAAKRSTTTIPIVFPVVGDAVAQGVVASLARPGGNITGSSIFSPELWAKRLELLKEAVPRITQVAVLLNSANTAGVRAMSTIPAAAKVLKLELQPIEVRQHKEIASSFAAMEKRRIDAIVVQQDTLFSSNAKEVADLAAKQQLPSAGTKEFAEAGGLIGYGANDAELYRRAAVFIDKILKGANPGEIPVEQPTKFELVINLKTAKSLGIIIPQSILVQATKVIE